MPWVQPEKKKKSEINEIETPKQQKGQMKLIAGFF